MNIYLPVANMTISVFSLVGLGVLSGFLSGLYGIGGGIIATPIMIFFGIPSNIIVGTASFQLLGSAIAGTLRNITRSGVDIKASLIMFCGSFFGSTIGTAMLRMFTRWGIEDFIISITFMMVITLVLIPVLVDISKSAYNSSFGGNRRKEIEAVRQHKLASPAKSKLHIYSEISQVEYNIVLVVLMGFVVGMLSGIIGFGGGAISIPIMMYTMGMSFRAASGISLLQIALTSVNTLMWQVMAGNVDIVLGATILLSSTFAAQFGTIAQSKLRLLFLRTTFAALLMLMLAMFAMRFVGNSYFGG